MSKNECRFYPVQCSYETFQTLSPQEGYVYFITDKKKIFLGKGGEMIPMHAGAGLFYGIKEIEYDNSGILPDPNVIFYYDELEGEDVPEEDDLILNVDGCFYRVKNVAEDGLETVRLTLQGTGGGSGGGGTGGGGGSTGGSFSLSIIDGKAKTYASTATSMEIKFKGNYNGTDDNVISGVAFKRKGDEQPFYTVDKIMAFNQEQSVDIFQYKHLFNTNKTTVTMYVYDLYGTERSTNITIQIVDLELRKIRGNLIASFTDTYNYACQLIGATSGVEDKKVVYSLYDESNLHAPVATWEKNLAATDEDEIQHGLNLVGLMHKSYVLKVQASARISGTTTTLTSNVLTHKLAYFTNTSNAPVLMVYIPEVTEQYTNIPIQYMLLASEANKEYTLDLSLDGMSQIQLKVQTNVAGEYPLYFEDKGTYTFTARVVELSLAYSTYLTIAAYTGNLPVIDSSRSDLLLYLNPRNKSNSAVDRDRWDDYRGRHEGFLSGLHYGTANGWLLDANENDTNYLQLSSGATFSMPNFRPFAKDPTKEDATDSSVGSGITIELDFAINGVLDYDTELISCLSKNKDGDIKVGFSVTGDKVRFYSDLGLLLSLSLVEDKRTRVSFVIEPNNAQNDFPMVYGYVNGILSGAVIYDKSSAFEDVSTGPATLRMNSADGQIRVYGVRVYSSALSDRVILNNYTASLSTLEERQRLYNLNNVYDAKGKIDLLKVSAEEYNLQVPYMILTGGYATLTDSKWQRKDSSDPEGRLPTGKKDYRMVDVKVKYPKTALFANYEDYEFTNVFASGKTMAEAYGEKPSNGGAIMYAQGTSSMEYPVKNLRLRFKNEEDWYVVRPDISPVEIICMKADYMESSGSHNTGSANLIDALYQGVGMKTPGQRAFGGEDKDTIVTCVKGHPCLIFYSPTGEEGSYEYIGKYNLNLDKATPKPFGFNHKDDFGWLHEGDSYYEVSYADKKEGYKEPFVGQLEPDEGADYVPDQTETERIVGANQKVNAIHCFEFLDNAIEVCNFLNKYKELVKDPVTGEMVPDPNGGTYTYEETWYNQFTNKDGDKVPGWALGFESRYPEDRIGFHDADTLYPLASWLNSLYALRIRDEAGKKEAIARFKNEYQCYLNKDFLLTYYLYTEALLMADSRVKNMMIATWGKENYGENGTGIGNNNTYSYYPLTQNEQGEWVPDNTQERVYTNNYIFYPIFYDMDTMLGLDNTGIYRFNYYDEDTNASIYNGEEVLWNFVRDALLDELTPWYTTLETASLTADKVLPYFSLNQANLANEAFYNGDAKYKYTDPARNGYHDDLYDKDIAPGDGPYLYAAQGDRSLMREWFVTNRFKFLRGKYVSGQFKGGDRIEYRWYYPSGSEDEFNGHGASVTAVPPSGEFTFKSLKTGYAGVQVGANAGTYVTRFNGEEEKSINALAAANANGTEAYILGLSNLSDLGDLSNKYMQKFIVGSSDVRLKYLTLGNPHKDYYNPYWATQVEGQASRIGLSGATYLEEFNLQNCSTYNNSLDFSACPVIRKILLTGSSVNAITLPKGGMISELRLPLSVTSLSIEDHSALTAANFSLGTYNYDTSLPYAQQKIGAGNGAYENDFTRISNLHVVNTPIDTYDIVTHAGNLEKYCLRGVEWNITENDTQYCIRYNSADLTPEQISSYYTYNPVSKEYEAWNQSSYPTEEGVYLYERFDLIVDGKIECIPALEYLKSKTIMGGATRPAEALTGRVTINIANPSGDKYTVNELEIYRKYADVYPDLIIEYGSNIEVEGAYTINFYYTDINEVPDDISILTPYYSKKTANNEETLAQLTSRSDFSNPNKSPTAMHEYHFLGLWTDVNTGATYYQDDFYPQGFEGSAIAFSSHYPAASMNLVPHFETTERLYTVEFYMNPDELLFYTQGLYQNNLETAMLGTMSEYWSKYQYKPADEYLDEHERYVLKGWISESDYNNNTPNPPLVNLSSITLTHDMKLFASFGVENAQAVASDARIFTIQANTQVPVGDTYMTGTLIQLNDNYAPYVGGKITLPSVDDHGNPILFIGDFSRALQITDIYFLPSAEYIGVANNSFGSMMQLTNVYLPDTMTYIGKDAFVNTTNLTNINLSDNIQFIGYQAFYNYGGVTGDAKLLIDHLPASLVTLGDRAFCNAGNGITIAELPNSLETIGTQAFMNCPNVTVHYFGGEGSALRSIGYEAFHSACTNDPSVTEIVINNGVGLQLGGTDEKYDTFGFGYLNVTKLRIGFEHKYGGDTAALISDLFSEPRDIEVHDVL